MKSQLNILNQLQELVLTRDEHHRIGDGSHMDALDQSIDSLVDKLEPQPKALYQRLYQKDHIVMSPMVNGCCAGCGMQVPIAQAQQVRLAQHLVTCSSCGRMLFAADDDAARNVSEKGDRDDAKTGISRFSAENLMIADLGACSREEAIARLAAAMAENGFISNPDSLITAALERENVLSTAMGDGLAFPHVRGVEGGGLTIALGISKNGIVYDDSGTKVKFIFFSVIPVAVSAFYLRLMSGLTDAFSKKANRDLLAAAKNSTELWKALMKTTRTTIQ